jgi:hypothetical protein
MPGAVLEKGRVSERQMQFSSLDFVQVHENLERGGAFFLDESFHTGEEFTIRETGQKRSRHSAPPELQVSIPMNVGPSAGRNAEW